ncbi:MAG TPA: 50S ribosomal protein L9 [Clostridiales bacterium]|nr:50S ribosomal protein L9 [Clostridiales bacterium]
MQVILTQDIKNLGKKGEMVNVSDGYARNYLFPRKLATEVNAQALTELKNREAAKQHKIDTEIANARANAEKLEGKTVKITAKAGQSGKLFGSITSKEIAEAIKEQIGIEIDRRKISVAEIKAYGTYPCEIKLYTGISATMYVAVGE